MTDRELRLRTRIDALSDEIERLKERVTVLERRVKIHRCRTGYWRRKAGISMRVRRSVPVPRFRRCADCGESCRGYRCLLCARRDPNFGKAREWQEQVA